jgi:hypothetical protein
MNCWRTLLRQKFPELWGHGIKNAHLYIIVMAGWLVSAHLAIAADCAGLLSARFSDAQIMKAERRVDGAFSAKNFDGAIIRFGDLPAFCRIVGVIRPTQDSKIGFEVWLPDQWNGRYLQVGNSGFAGSIIYTALMQGLRNGYAVANTDDGHSGPSTDAIWALNHSDKVIDYGYRAVHLANVTAKSVIKRYYGHALNQAYFNGCSDGGREGLMEAQRYPDDFDGWVVGAPANNFTGAMLNLLNNAQIVGALIEPLTGSQLESLSKATIAQCDGVDGVVDGVIDESAHAF